MPRLALLSLALVGLVAIREATAGTEDLPGLVRDLTAGDVGQRREARDGLVAVLLIELPRGAEIPATDRPLLEHVSAALASDDPTVRILAAAAAARLGAGARPLLDDLARRLPEDIDAQRYWILETIRRLGPAASSAAPAVARILHENAEWGWTLPDDWSPDRDWRDVGNLTVAALVAIGPDSLLATLKSLERRDHGRSGVHDSIALLERLYGEKPVAPPPVEAPVAGPAVTPEKWREQLEGEDAKGGEPGIERVFVRLASLGEDAVLPLLHAARSERERVRLESLRILVWLGPRARAAAPDLFDLAADDDPDVRYLAITALAATGAGDPAWVPALLSMLSEPGGTRRRAAARCLGAIGPPAAEARPRLVEMLLEPAPKPPTGYHGPWSEGIDEHVLDRAAAAEALGRIGGPAEVLVGPLLRAGATRETWSGPPHSHKPFDGPPWMSPYDRQPFVNMVEVAADAIGRLGLAALGAVKKALESPGASLRAQAALTLSRFSPDAVGSAALLAAGDPEAGVREAVTGALGRSSTIPATRALADLVADPVPEVRRAAVSVLHGMGPRAEAAAPALVRLFLEGEPVERYRVLDAFVEIRPDAESLLAPALAAGLGGIPRGDPTILSWIGRLGTAGERVTARVASVAPTLDERGKLAALDALGKIAPGHAASLAVARKLARDESGRVRMQALGLIRRADIPDAETLAVLIAGLDDEDDDVAVVAAHHLSDLAPECPPAAAALAKRISDRRDHVRMQAALALAAIGSGETAAKVCIALLSSESKDVRVAAIECITEIGEVANALGPLRRRLGLEKAHEVRGRLLPAIASTGAEGTAFVIDRVWEASRDRSTWYRVRPALAAGGVHAVAELRRWTGSRDPSVYYAGASMLGTIGPAARDAIPDLVKLANSGQSQALEGATEALIAVGAPTETVLPLMERCLADEPPFTSRAHACSLLARRGVEFAPLLPAVCRALPHLRSRSLEDAVDWIDGLGDVGVPAIAPHMVRLAGSRDGDRHLVVRALGLLADRSGVPRAALLNSLEDPSRWVRIAAVEAIAAHLADDAEAVARAGARLADPDPAVRARVAEVLRDLGPQASPARSALLRAAETTKRVVSRPSLRALAAMPEDAAEIRPRLLAMAEGDDAWRVHDALAALGELGGPHEILLPVFRAALARWDWRVRVGAIRGLVAWLGESPELGAILGPLAQDPSFPVRHAAEGE